MEAWCSGNELSRSDFFLLKLSVLLIFFLCWRLTLIFPDWRLATRAWESPGKLRVDILGGHAVQS